MVPPSDRHRQGGAVRHALAVATGAAGVIAVGLLASIVGLLPSFALIADRTDHAGPGSSIVGLDAAPVATITPEAPPSSAPGTDPATGTDLPSVELAGRPAPTGVTPTRVLAPSPPIDVTLPSIGVTSPLEHLGRQVDGSIAAPVDFDRAGWFEAGPQPGQPGPAVIAGHVDSTTGPAVFYRLRDLQPGDPVEVRREDGSVVTFRVTRLEQHPKDEFPSEAVYGPVPDAELRLITCGGDFNRSTGHYLDNLVVYAVAT